MIKVDLAIKRITEMEAILDEAIARMAKAAECPGALLDFQPEIKRLSEYYESRQWKDDFALDEEGLLPKDLKRGVLSEDGIFDALEKNKELIERIRGTKMVKHVAVADSKVRPYTKIRSCLDYEV